MYVDVYRLEHRSSRLGPFEHKSSRQKHPDQKVIRYLRTDAGEQGFMPDITDSPVAKQRIKENPKAVFGWTAKDHFLRMIKDPVEVENLGFVLAIYYQIKPIYISKCGQVIFNRSLNDYRVVEYLTDLY